MELKCVAGTTREDPNFQLKLDLLGTTLSIVSDGEDLGLSYLVKYIVKVSDYV